MNNHALKDISIEICSEKLRVAFGVAFLNNFDTTLSVYNGAAVIYIGYYILTICYQSELIRVLVIYYISASALVPVIVTNYRLCPCECNF